MVMPALAAAYAVAAPVRLRTRLTHLLGAAAAFAASAGWFVVLTMAWPPSERPYLAGSTDNNFMNLVLGYNGLARVLGRDHGGAFMFGPSIGSALRSTVRVSAARHMLESNHRSVQEISEAVGYQDVAFFRSLFQRHTGSSPSAYQRSFVI